MIPRPPSPLQSQMMLLGCGSSGSGAAAYTPWLDAVEAKCIAAYGFQRLITGVTDATRVRDFAVAELDVGTLADGGYDLDGFSNHVAAEGGQGFAAKLYDHKSSGDLVQATAGAQPEIILSSGLNNKPAAVFTGSHFMGTAGAVTGTDFGTGDFEIWYVVRPTSFAADAALGALGTAAPEMYFMGGGNAGKLNIYIGGGGHATTTVYSVNTNYVVRFSRRSGTCYIEVNGAEDAASFANATNFASTAAIALGSYRVAGGADYAQAQIAFNAWFNNSLTSGEAAALLATIKTFYGIA